MSDRIIVIADDLTGAAEIAGIGLRHGLRVELVPDATAIERVDATAELVVLNTDSRPLPAGAAADRIRRLVPLVEAAKPVRVYKKIDSVLRGNVRAEIDAWIDASAAVDRAFVVAQNPSRGRTIDAAGIYCVDGVPLDQTTFARDPDHPRMTSDAAALLGEGRHDAVIGRAVTLDEVRRHVASLAVGVLPVGGADFFEAILRCLHDEVAGSRAALTSDARSGAARVRSAPAYSGEDRILFLSGTADAKTRAALVGQVPSATELPVAWFVGDGPTAHAVAEWASRLRERRVAALIAPAERCEPARVHSLLCDAAAALIEPPIALYVDGGATAMALCRRMGWTALDVVAEVGPGAVTLAPTRGIEMTIKPGSYAWPARVWDSVESKG